MFRRLLICTDLKDGLHRLVHHLADLQVSGVEQVVFCHCVAFWKDGEIPHEDQKRIQEAHDRLDVALDQVPPGLDVHVEVLSGSMPELSLAMVEKYQPQLLILGSATRSFITEKLFGSTAIALAQRCHLPLLVLRPQLISAYRHDELALRCQHLWQELLIPFDGSESGTTVMEQLQPYLSQNHPPSLKKCWLEAIVDSSNRRMPNQHKVEQAQATLAQVTTNLEAQGLEVVANIREGDAVQEVIEIACQHDISAIAIGYRRGDGLRDWSIPSFSNEILRRSWYPVLLFPWQPKDPE